MLTNAATREMRSFSSLEENTLYVFRPEGSKSPELIGVTKGENNSSLFQPLTGTEEDKRKPEMESPITKKTRQDRARQDKT